MPWVSIREAAEMLKLSTRTIERMVAAGTLRKRMERGLRLVLLGPDGDLASGQGGGPLDPELLEHLFDVFEGLWTLRVRSYGLLVAQKALEHVFAAFHGHEGQATLKQWRHLYLKIKTCHGTVEGMVRERRCSAGSLQEVYRAMILVRITWGHYAHRHRSDTASPEESLAGKEDSHSLMTGIIGHLRRLLVGCATRENG